MKKNIWCVFGFHKWVYIKPDNTIRKCKLCSKVQELINAGEEASGMASGSYWDNIK